MEPLLPPIDPQHPDRDLPEPPPWRRTDEVQLSGFSWYQALLCTRCGTRPNRTVAERISATAPMKSMTRPIGSITVTSASYTVGPVRQPLGW